MVTGSIYWKVQMTAVVSSMLLLLVGTARAERTAYFVDGYHGGIYGHYPMWQARFMLDNLNKYPQWKINLEIEPETWDVVKENDPDNYEALRKYYADTGRFGRIEFVNPAYAQPYCYNISGESIIRQFSYGMAKIREHFPEAAFLTYSSEEPCFTGSLPQILKGLGYKYAVMRNPDTCWGGYTAGFGQDLVNWIGPDGTSIPTVPRYACEKLKESTAWQTTSYANSEAFIQDCFNDSVKFPVGMCLQDAGWKHGPWLENAIKDFYRPSEYVVWTDYIEEIKDHVQVKDWKVSEEDIKPGLVWGAQVLQKMAQKVRVSENRMIMAEKASAFNAVFNGGEWSKSGFAEAWRTLMLAQHHDCWIVPYNNRSGETFAVKASRWTAASDTFAGQEILKLFPSSSDDGSKARSVRVFNMLGITRTDRVELALPGWTAGNVGVYTADGELLESQWLKSDGESPKLCFDATAPGMGYATFLLKEENVPVQQPAVKKLPNGSLLVDTDFYTVKFDPARGGAITGLTAKKLGNRSLIENGGALNDLRGFFYEKDRFIQLSDSRADISVVEDGPLFVRVQIDGRLDKHRVRQLVDIPKTQPRIDFSLQIDWDGKPGIGEYDQRSNYRRQDHRKAFYNDEFKLHLRFPLKGMDGKLFKNAPFNVCESRLENTVYDRWDAIKHNVILNWVDVQDQGGTAGVALFSDHTTSYLQTDKLPLGLTVQFVGKALWGKNYTLDGPTRMNYALLPHSGTWEEAGVAAASDAWNEPMIARLCNTVGGDNSKSLLETSDPNLALTSAVMDGNDLIVRFFNVSSKNNRQGIRWGFPVKHVERVDLNGNSVEDLSLAQDSEGRNVTVLSIPQFGFRTLKVTRAGAE